MQKEKLEEKNLFELRIIGSEMGVKGVSRLKKEDLIKSILDKSTEITRLYYSKQKKTPNENKLDILLKEIKGVKCLLRELVDLIKSQT